jgi:hypothetical protein
MQKLLVIYNTCGIRLQERDIDNVPYYIMCLENLLSQTLNDYTVVLSSCKNSPQCIKMLIDHFGDRIDYSLVDEIVPINVTLNHAAIECIKKYGSFEGYLYLDSGSLLTTSHDLQHLYNLMKSGPYGMVSALANCDNGLEWIYPDIDVLKILQTHNFIIPLGRGVNNHIQVFTHELVNYYGKIVPDIFASYCTESVFSCMCAALNLKWVLSNSVRVNHHPTLDGASSGFDPVKWEKDGNKTYDHPFMIHSIMDRICTDEARRLGLGYEECRQIMMHDPSQYDNNGFCTNDQLKDFIKEKLFLTKEEFDYSKMNYKFGL